MVTMMTMVERKPLKIVLSIVVSALLLYSWRWLWYWSMFLTEVLLVPWDTSTVRPPVGYWQRTVNDLFESPPGSWLPAAVIIGLQIVLFVALVWRTRRPVRIAAVFAASNLLIVPLHLVLFQALSLLEPLWRRQHEWTTEQWQYWGSMERNIPMIVLTLLLFGALTWVQVQLGRGREG